MLQLGIPLKIINPRYGGTAHTRSFQISVVIPDSRHLSILRQGVEKWNEWRKKKHDHNFRPFLVGVNLSGEDLSGIDLSDAILDNSNLAGARLVGANLNGVTLAHAQLQNAVITGANLGGALLIEADLSKVDLTGTELGAATLTRANLTRASLRLARFSCYSPILRRRLSPLIGDSYQPYGLRHTRFKEAIVDQTTFTDVDLSSAEQLETLKHDGPSFIGIDTIYRSHGKIPQVFLRSAGVPEPFITNMNALIAAMEPIHFYSCFISYSSKDQGFAERLHSDLQSKGVRCWFATEDLKIGDKLRSSFDQAIRVHDKVMVLLSESSVKSPWVEKEVETAFEKERQQNRKVLFPIRLDNAVMETQQAWAADIRRTRHIGDFCNWKTHDSYKKAFDRLLRDLKAEKRD